MLNHWTTILPLVKIVRLLFAFPFIFFAVAHFNCVFVCERWLLFLSSLFYSPISFGSIFFFHLIFVKINRHNRFTPKATEWIESTAGQPHQHVYVRVCVLCLFGQFFSIASHRMPKHSIERVRQNDCLTKNKPYRYRIHARFIFTDSFFGVVFQLTLAMCTNLYGK